MVKVRRGGSPRVYSLYDHHAPDLPAAMRHHYEHVAEGDAAAVKERLSR